MSPPGRPKGEYRKAQPEEPASRPARRAPGALRIALETRAPAEAAASLALWPWLALGAARGDGHPVLVLPGLGASDVSTTLLRRWLRRQGFAAHGWGLGRNLGPRPGVWPGLLARLDAIQAESGRSVSLVGWSLGGIYARELAKARPGAVRQVLTLGSPLPGERRASNADWYYRRAAGRHAEPPELMQQLKQPVPAHIPVTAVYSVSDGIIDWRASLQPEGPRRQNIRVSASHTGMGAHPVVLRLLAERLAQRADDWQPHPTGRAGSWAWQPPAWRAW